MNPGRRQILRLGAFLLAYPFGKLKFNYPEEGDRMQVSLERSGGFANIPVSVTVDTDALSPDEVAQLRQWIEQSQFFDLPSNLMSSRQPDRFQYEITVQEGDRSHRVTVSESALPETLKPLVRWLMDQRTGG